MQSLTKHSKEPVIAKNAISMTSRVNPKFKAPDDMPHLEKAIRICLGLPFYGKASGQIPYAYVWDDATGAYQPNLEVFKLLWQARRYLYTSSLREVTDWLNLKASKLNYNVPISHMGLRNLMIMRPPLEECLIPQEEKEKIVESITAWNKSQKD